MIAAFMLSAGFVAVSAETAQAACKPTRYVQCTATTPKASVPKKVKKNKKAKVGVTIRTQGNKKALGTVTVVIRGPKGFKTYKKTVSYKGKRISVLTSKFKKKGTYKVTIIFKGKSPFKDSKKTYTIKVK
ncbi:hypothetical protein [Nocardioides sp. URHA0020]|uniref:hypothetical protein n=1 Tax=Nocardioides sp. URHA0020 TaxID=1380392 RepID=UPI0012DF6891|nr:hypothetical protein [Nocardioides sp. URHA0020]